MQAKRSRSSRRQPQVRVRRWQVPPPITREPGGRLPALPILEEFPGETGILLWQSLRSVLSWEKAKKGQRKRLFLPGAAEKRRADLRTAALPAELEEPVAILAGVLDGSATAKKLAVACRRISEWANGQELVGTALGFMQAAALTAPNDASMAYQTGRLARRRAEYEVAESWFDEAASRALEHRDWETYGRVFIGMGNLHLQRGNLPAAARFHRKAQATGIKHGLSEIQGMAAHDLFVIANRKHDRQEAEALAMAAIRAYGPGHHRLPSIANDLACLWADSGEFERAYSVFRAVLPHISSLRERLLTLGSLARAAGAVADRDAFESAWTAVWEAANAGGAAEEAAEALIGLGQGAANLQDWERAHQAAERAALLAAERREAMSQFVAESVRDAADARRGLGAEAAPRREDPLVAELIASLDTVPIGA